MSKRTSQLAFPVVAVFILAVLFGLVAPAAAQSEGRIGGIVYADKNGNGVREEGEEGLKSVEVTFNSGGWSTTLSTADNGAFSLDANPATWTVTVHPPAGYRAPKESVQAFIQNPGDVVANIEFGLVPTGEDGEVLPNSGGVVSGGVMVAGLVGVMLIGIALVVVGQIRSKRSTH